MILLFNRGQWEYWRDLVGLLATGKMEPAEYPVWAAAVAGGVPAYLTAGRLREMLEIMAAPPAGEATNAH